MVDVMWLQLPDPESFVRRILSAEAPDIPAAKLAGRWEQTVLPWTELSVNSRMVTAHDADPVHRERRDQFVALIHAGAPLPPLIALGPDRFLVDGYARLRAARLLDVAAVEVIVQRTTW